MDDQKKIGYTCIRRECPHKPSSQIVADNGVSESSVIRVLKSEKNPYEVLLTRNLNEDDQNQSFEFFNTSAFGIN